MAEKYELDLDQVRRRVAAKTTALEVFNLAKAMAADIESDATEAFWTLLRDNVLANAPLPPTAVRTTIEPMSDAECLKFEKQPWPLTRFKDMPIGLVIERDVEYVLWVAEQTFMDSLRRYLRNSTIRRQLGLPTPQE